MGNGSTAFYLLLLMLVPLLSTLLHTTAPGLTTYPILSYPAMLGELISRRMSRFLFYLSLKSEVVTTHREGKDSSDTIAITRGESLADLAY